LIAKRKVGIMDLYPQARLLTLALDKSNVLSLFLFGIKISLGSIQCQLNLFLEPLHLV